MKKQLTFLTFLLLCVITQTFGQAPHAFKYQTIARSNSGNIIGNQLVSFRMSILHGSITGPVSYSEKDTATTNQFGLANLVIGSGSVLSGKMDTINWGNSTYYLKIEFDPTGGNSFTLMGTSQMLSVPYALYSQSTGDTSMWKKQLFNVIYYSKGDVGIGPLGVVSLNALNTPLTIQAPGISPYTTNYGLNIYAGSNTTGYGTKLTFSFGSSPSHLVGASIGSQVEASSGKNLIFYTTNGNLTPGNELERMRITGNGFVGIGSNAPTSALQVVGLPVYANNAAAVTGGLTSGAFYRTGADPDAVCVVH